MTKKGQPPFTHSSYRSQLHNERVETESQYQKLQQDSAKIEHKSDLLELRAPQAGIIKDLATHTRGGVARHRADDAGAA